VSEAQAATAVPTGNTYDKYGSTNPLVKRLMRGFHDALDELWAISDSSGDQVSLLDTISDPSASDPQEALDTSEVKERLSEGIASLPEREQLVVALYYYESLTLREIGEVLGVTESRVSQLHTKAVLRLKARLSGYPARAGLES